MHPAHQDRIDRAWPTRDPVDIGVWLSVQQADLMAQMHTARRGSLTGDAAD